MAKKNSFEYRLYGIVNESGHIPSFVQPVFKRNENYYFGRFGDNSKYTAFEMIERNYDIKPIAGLGTTMVGINKNLLFYIGDPVIFAMEQQPNIFYIADVKSMLKALSSFKTTDENFRSEIEDAKQKIISLRR